MKLGICFWGGAEKRFFTVKSTQLFRTETITSSAKPSRMDFSTPSSSENSSF